MLHLIVLALAGAPTPATPQVGVGLAAPSTITGQPATFDLAGFRLGMREADVEQILRARGMRVRRRTRTKTFEDNVRSLVNVRGGHLPMKGGDVLDEVELDDGNGGKVMLRMLPWPDGAHVRSVVYLPPTGTCVTAWRSLLVKKYGVPSKEHEDMAAEELHATWCGRSGCDGSDRFSLVADVSVRGGQVVLSPPDSTAGRLKELVETEAEHRSERQAPAL